MKKHKQNSYKPAKKKKLASGGFTDYLKNNQGNVQTGLALAGTATGSLMGDSTAGAGLSGAMSGAAAGSVAGPVGMAAGAIVGGASGIMNAQKAKQEEERMKRELKRAEGESHRQWSETVLRGYDSQGVKDTNYYADGGKIKKKVAAPDVSTKQDITRVAKAPVRMKQADKVEPTGNDAKIGNFLRGISPLPNNVDQALLSVVGLPADVNSDSMTDAELLEAYRAVKNAQKRTGKNSGGTMYQDFDTEGEFEEYFNKGKLRPDVAAIRSMTDSRFRVASWLGRSSFREDENDPDKIHLTDRYDWNGGKENKFDNKDDQTYANIRNWLNENGNTEQDSYRPHMNLTFSKREMDAKLAKLDAEFKEKGGYKNTPLRYDNEDSKKVQEKITKVVAPIVTTTAGSLIKAGKKAASNEFVKAATNKGGTYLKKGLSQVKFAEGGNTPAQYEVEQDEIVQGTDTQLEEGTAIASDLMKVGGERHEDGGTDGMGGERVFSDRLTSISGKTFAAEAERLGKQKGKLEKKAGSNLTASKNTAERMTQQLDAKLDNLFNEQESQKEMARPKKKMAFGGDIGIDPKTGLYTDDDNKNGAYSQYGKAHRGLLNGSSTMLRKGDPNNKYDYNVIATTAKDGKGTTYYKYDENYDSSVKTIDPLDSKIKVSSFKDMAVKPVAATPTGVVGSPEIENTGYRKGSEFGNLNSLGGYGQFLDNGVNALLRTPNVPRPVKQGLVRLDKTVDINPDLKAVDDAQRNLNLNIDQTSSSHAVGRANKMGAFARTLDAKGGLYASKRNEERGIANQEQMINKDIIAGNNALENDYSFKKMMRTDDVNRRISQNFANLSDDLQGMNRDARLDAMDIERTRLAMKRNPDVVANMLSGNPKFAEHFTDAELEELESKVQGTENKKRIQAIRQSRKG